MKYFIDTPISAGLGKHFSDEQEYIALVDGWVHIPVSAAMFTRIVVALRDEGVEHCVETRSWGTLLTGLRQAD